MTRFADIQILRYKLDGFEQLTLNEKKYIYALSQATLWGRDITFDQFGSYNILIRKLMEVVCYEADVDDVKLKEQLFTYLRRVWFSNGIYHHYSCKKMLPEFSSEQFWAVVSSLPADRLPLNGMWLAELQALLSPVMFNPDVLPQRVNHNESDDLLLTSACNFYGDGVNQNEAAAYYEAKRKAYADANPQINKDEQPSWGLNSRLVKDANGNLEEETCCIGGRYSAIIERIVFWLNEAMKYAADDNQREIISLLVKYYTTGCLEYFDDYSIRWVTDTKNNVDFINGFIEVYGDPIGLKGSWEGIVHYKDKEACRRTEILCSNAQWFEDNSPVRQEFKKPVVKGVTANVVRAAMLGGDEYPSTAIGINLPNADWIRAKHGSKSITISNLTAAYDEAAKGNGFREEYIPQDDVRELINSYSNLTDDLHTDLHECLGHGSGRLLPGVAADALKSYASTIEEARADLFGLYYMADPKLVSLGLLPDSEAYKAQYYTYMLNGLLTQCVRIPLGEDIQEAHMRNRAIIANWTYEQTSHDEVPAVELFNENGKTYMRINNYERLHELFGNLLAEVQRMKSEGDWNAAHDLVENYGVKLNPELHKEIYERYKKLNIAPYKGFLNPLLSEVKDNDGNVIDIAVSYDEDYDSQMMRYSTKYSV